MQNKGIQILFGDPHKMIAMEPSASVYRAWRRKPSVDVVRVKELRDSGMGASAIAKQMGIGRASVYRALG
jgi:DNA invertase Pin-like site-specific DNA recombinase